MNGEPTTEAGRAMLRDPMYRFAIGHILAIEAEARATPTPGLDAERLARAMWNVRIAHPRGFVTHDERAEAVAAEYAALSASGETET